MSASFIKPRLSLRERFRRHPLTRAMAVLTVTTLVQTSVPVWAAEEAPAPASSTPTAAEPAPPPAPPAVEVNHKVPAVSVPPASPRFSPDASSAEIRAARVFGEPLVPLGGTPSPEENRALAQALTAALGRSDIAQRLAVLENFLSVWPESSWRASLQANLGVLYRRHGYFTRAETALTRAWDLARSSSEPGAQAVAGTALEELLELNMRFGRVQPLETLLAQIGDRVFLGSPVERIREARSAVWILRNEHHRAIPSGPRALARVQAALHLGSTPSPEIAAFHADEDGATLLEMKELAQRSGLKLRPAVRGAAAEIPLPAVMHFKIGHFSALLKREGNHYLIDDACLGGEVWVSAEALEEESSGYFLIAQDGLPKGWREPAASEMETVRGKCAPANPSGEATGTCHHRKGGNCNGGSCGTRLASYGFHELLASLHIEDAPVGYNPPRGPAVEALVTYNQRESYKPLTYTFTNLGSRWNLVWVAWVEDDPPNLSGPAYVHMAGGGRQTATGFSGSSYAPDRDTQAVLTRTSTSPIRYERLLPDGSVEVYAQADGAATSPRRIFLTEQRDPQGNALTFTYDAQLRLAAVTDAIGQVTTLSYERIADPLKPTKITDPFGRSATFEYDGTGRLISITDVIGMKSQFQYGREDFIGALTTPYGTTTFARTYGLNIHADFGVEAIDPLGGRERIEWYTVAPLPATDPPASVPPGFADRNTSLNMNSTYYWDKRAMALFPGDHSKAQITKWNFGVMGYWDSVSTTKMPLEGRVWYSYPNQPNPGHYVGPLNKPTKVARVLDDGQAQVYQYEYNAKGLRTKAIDPLGRETVYVYGTGSTPDPDPATGSGLDLLQVKQKNPSGATGCTAGTSTGCDLLASYIYNAQHRMLTSTDGAAQTTTLTYLSDGRLQTVVTPPRNGPNGQSLTVAERTTTYSYFADNAPSGPGALQTVTGPSTPQGSPTLNFTYDGYGRVRTTTDADNYTRTYDYDALDRVTRLTYPDGTYEEAAYNRLDAEGRRDRLGRWSHTFHDALRRVIATRDALGRTTTGQWCTCGSLDKVIDASGNAITWERDVQGRTTREVRADNAAWEYTYENTTSRLKQRKDPKLQITGYEYFLDDQLKQMTYSGALVPTANVSFTYDPNYGRLATLTDGTGTSTYSYHPFGAAPSLSAGRLASVDGPLADDTVSYTYEALGRLASRGLSSFTSGLTYDALGRLAKQASPVGDFTVAYDGRTGRPLSLTYPNGQATQYTYFPNSGDHRVQEIKHLGPGGATLSKYNYTYDVESNVQSWTQQVGAAAAKVYGLGYDPADQLTSATLKTTDPTPVILRRYGYAYDLVGSRTAEQVDDAATSWTPNNRNQVVSRQAGGPLFFRGTVSEPATVTVQGAPAQVAPDNRFEGQAPVPAGTSTVTIVAQDYAQPPNVRTNTYQLDVSGAGTTYSYDANGNLTGDGTRTFEWDAENRLTAVKQGATVLASFAYDGRGRRAQKVAGGVTHTYIYDAEDILEERLSSGQTIRFVHGPGIDQPLAQRDGAGAVSYYLADHLGSVIQVTNGSGVTTLAREYDPWGNLLQGSATSGYAFSGREWDAEVGLNYYRARYYDTKLGRFLSEDPIGLAGGINFYSYVTNRPTVLNDPLGLDGGSGMQPPMFGPPRQSAIQCAVAAYEEEYAAALARGNQTGQGGWRFAHCMSACRARKCGVPPTLILYAGRRLEEKQVVECVFLEKGWTGDACESAMADADFKDNRHGATCPSDEPCPQRCRGRVDSDKGPDEFGPFWGGPR